MVDAKKIIGIIVSLLGVVGIVFFNKIKTLSALSFLSDKPYYLIIVMITLLIIGVFLIISKPKAKEKEVPIYKGDEVVGYRKITGK